MLDLLKEAGESNREFAKVSEITRAGEITGSDQSWGCNERRSQWGIARKIFVRSS